MSQNKKEQPEDDNPSDEDVGLTKVIKDIGVVGISKILLALSGIILLPVLTKNLGAYGYGLWVQVIASFSILFPIISLGFPNSMARFFPSKDIKKISDDFYSVMTIVILIASIVSVLIYFFPSALANALFDGKEIIVRILAIIVFVRSLDNVLLLVFRAFREMKKYATINVITKYAEMVLAILLVLKGFGLIGALFALIVVRTSILFILTYLVIEKIPIGKPNFSSIKKYLKFGLPLVPKQISTWVIKTSDRFVIGFFLGATFVGYYAPAYSLGIMIPSSIGWIFGFVLPPTLSNYYENNNIDLINKIFNLCNKYFFLISIPYLIGIIILGQPILELITTPKIAQEGYKIMILSSTAGIFFTLKITLGNILFIFKKTKYIMIATIISAGVNIVGNIILVPRIGIIGAGITTLTCYILTFILIGYWSIKVKDFELTLYKLKIPILKIIFSTLTMGAIIYSLYYFFFIHYLILVVLGIGIYFLILWFIGGIDQKEIRYLKNLRDKSR